MATKKDELIRTSEEPHTLKRDMTESEKQFDQEQLLQVLQKIEDLDDEKKSVLAEIGARNKKYVETYKDIKQRLQSGKIMQSVMCDLTLNFTTLVATVVNQETGELVQSRPMTQEERNSDATPELPFEVDAEPEETVVEGSDPTTEVVPKGTPAQLADNPSTKTDSVPDAESGRSVPDPMTKDEVNAHATEKFGSNPQSAPSATDQNGATDSSAKNAEKPSAKKDSSSEDAQADDDLALWMGMEGGG